ncbi:hypothetical protein B0H11DRAFT_2047229, partial [Mycena galericulata]
IKTSARALVLWHVLWLVLLSAAKSSNALKFYVRLKALKLHVLFNYARSVKPSQVLVTVVHMDTRHIKRLIGMWIRRLLEASSFALLFLSSPLYMCVPSVS